MPQLLIRHKVADYEKWKPVFDAHAPIRKAGGVTSGRLFRNADDPSEILTLFEIGDLEPARRFTQSDDLWKAMQEAGVVDKPDFYFLEELEHFGE